MELDSSNKNQMEDKKLENLNFELHKQEDKFQELVLGYNKICKKTKIFINSSCSGSSQMSSGLRISLKTDKKSKQKLLKIINKRQ